MTMMKNVLMIIKKIIVAILFIYTYNIIVFPLGIIIPINIFNVLIVSFFGLPAIIVLCLFSIFVV